MSIRPRPAVRSVLRSVFSSLVVVLVLGIELAEAAEECIAGACFPSSLSVGKQELPLRGTALLEYLFFDVYSAAFYADSSVDTVTEALSDTSKAVVVHYHRSLGREEFIDSTEKILQNNPEVDPEEIRSELRQLYAIYKDVGAGDRYAASYAQGEGTTLVLNGVEQGVIPGAKFQRAYFSIWLSQYSVSSKFTESLLRKGNS